MTSRQRMLDSFRFKDPDKIPVWYHPSTAGFHVHGKKLLDLLNEYPPDNPVDFSEIPSPPEDAIDIHGSYHEFKRDAWGVEWEYRIFGIAGHPKSYPFSGWEQAIEYSFPPLPLTGGHRPLRSFPLHCSGKSLSPSIRK